MWIYQIRHQRDRLYVVNLVEFPLRPNHNIVVDQEIRMLSRVFQDTAMRISWKFVTKFFENVLVRLGTASCEIPSSILDSR